MQQNKQLSELVERYLELYFTDGDRTREKDKAVNEYEKYKETVKDEVSFEALQRVEKLEKAKIQIGEKWRELSDEMFDLQLPIAKIMAENNMTVIHSVMYNKRPVNVAALPNFKLEVKQY
jgi:predicted nuclease with TOPRIM domain